MTTELMFEIYLNYYLYSVEIVQKIEITIDKKLSYTDS